MADYKSQQINRGSISEILQLIQGFSSGHDKGTAKSSFYDTVYSEFYRDIHSSGTTEQVQTYITDLDAFNQKNITKMNDNDIQRFEFLKDQAENQKKLILGFDMSMNKVFGEDGISNKYIQLLEDYQGASEENKPIISNKLGKLKFLIFALLLVYSGFYMLTTTDPVWFVLVTMLSFKLSDELD